MLLGSKPLIFKVDPVTTGSGTLVVGTEEMPPGNKIPTHKHLYEDEVIFVHKGAVRVTWRAVSTTPEPEPPCSSRTGAG
jgi:quercetin dioxygenase-like cupin family protein